MAQTTSTAVVASQAPNPQDDFFHPVGDDPSWSESYYFYYFDPSQGIGGITLAGLTGVFRRVVFMAAGAVMMAATAAGLLLSAGIGLFGYQESLAVPYAMSSLAVEFAGAAVLAAASAIVLAARPGSRPVRR